jgi:hypothetical protein
MAHLATKNGKKYIRDDWHEEDIQSVAEQYYGITLSNEKLLRVMENIVHHHDANHGINWDTIEAAIGEVMRTKKVSL